MDKSEEISQFFDETKTNELLRAALMQAEREDDVIEVAHRFGYGFSSDDVAALRDEKYGPMDDASMENMQGGTSDPVRDWGTSRWVSGFGHYINTGQSGGII